MKIIYTYKYYRTFAALIYLRGCRILFKNNRFDNKSDDDFTLKLKNKIQASFQD